MSAYAMSRRVGVSKTLARVTRCVVFMSLYPSFSFTVLSGRSLQGRASSSARDI
jgi:hypothetical protein